MQVPRPALTINGTYLATINAGIDNYIRSQKATLGDASPTDPRWGPIHGAEAGRAQMPALVHDDLVPAMKRAFTEAVRRIYQVSIFIVLLGLLVTLLAPEVPLRGGGKPGPPAVE